jgi:hypothetical protein
MEERSGKKRRSEAERLELLERWEASGVTISDFCRETGISPGLFYTWRQKLRSPAEKKASFVEVTGSIGPVGGRYEVVCANGRTVRVPAGLSLSELLKAVEGI